MVSAGFMANSSVVFKSLKKECPDGTVWVFFSEGDGYIHVSINGDKNGEKIKRNYIFRNHRYLIYEIPNVIKRSAWIWTLVQILDGIASKYD